MAQADFSSLYQSLNQAQKEAVDKIEGPVLVLAGPGTGKTQLLAARIANILLKTDSNPENILCLTYTDAGAVAMRKRLFAFIGNKAFNLQIHTFHSFCNKVIQENQEYFGAKALQLLGELEESELLNELLIGLPINHPLKKPLGENTIEIKQLKNLFSLIKKEYLDVEAMLDTLDNYCKGIYQNEKYLYQRNSRNNKKGDPKQHEIDAALTKMNKLKAALSLFPEYQLAMKQKQRYDYFDMIDFVIKAFEQNEQLLLNYQEEIHYFLVDEFQDTNGAQSKILSLLAGYWGVDTNLFVVGDDDQGIYSFQGAEISRIKDFVQQYQIKEPVVLTENYRSTQAILDTAARLIKNNETRLINTDSIELEKNAKDLKASNPIRQKNIGEVRIRTYVNNVQEAASIAAEIKNKHEAGTYLGDTAIIYRSHSDIKDIISLFKHYKVPYNAKQKVNILEEPIILHLLTLLRFLNHEIETIGAGNYLYYELLHLPYWGIEQSDINTIAHLLSTDAYKYKTTWRQFVSDKTILSHVELKSKEAIDRLEQNLLLWQNELVNLPLPLALENILTQSGMLAYIMKQDDKLWQLEIVKTFFGFVENEHQINKQYGLSQLLDNFKKMNAFGISLDLERVVQNSDGVNLITAHSSKGLEFETVYIIKADSKSWEERKANQSSNIAGLKELLVEMGIAPEEKDMEEERRLFYVAITRAKQNLYISYPLMKLKDSSTQESTAQNSIFVSELELPKVHVETSEAELCDFLLKSLEKVSHPIGVEQHQKIKTYLEKFELSASALNKYLNCPVTFYYETVLNIPQARSEYAGFGSAIHYAFQKFFEAYRSHETKEKPSLDYFLKQFKIGMMKEEVNFPKDTLDDRIKYGSNLLKEYYEQFSDNWPVDTLTEYKINTHTPKGTPIKGNIDRLDITQVGTSKEVTIIDYKTGSVKNLKKKSASPTETNPLGSDYWRQMQFYKVLVEFDKKQTWQSNQGKFLPILKADNDKFQEFIEINFNPLHTDLIINLMDETYQKIMNQEFEIGCGKTECRWCNFQKQLQV